MSKNKKWLISILLMIIPAFLMSVSVMADFPDGVKYGVPLETSADRPDGNSATQNSNFNYMPNDVKAHTNTAPEAATTLLLGSGLVGLFVIRKRVKKA